MISIWFVPIVAVWLKNFWRYLYYAKLLQFFNFLIRSNKFYIVLIVLRVQCERNVLFRVNHRKNDFALWAYVLSIAFGKVSKAESGSVLILLLIKLQFNQLMENFDREYDSYGDGIENLIRLWIGNCRFAFARSIKYTMLFVCARSRLFSDNSRTQVELAE